ncbi:GntR family transcriptional regulator [Streptomyces purpureus]|uniref:GntR family transcriptional regulator n=1 Tax=Streptomyces purpureus TaxID=1951 RepID=A0A918H2K9_9ACTN|nr:GntR family transcriptional regulator [Streptomyces purpureus]GGT29571.1 GntR family transcriptional regulator [Streptomyces purpureus]
MAEPDHDRTELPLYLRVATALRDDLTHRRIPPGSRLPSERSMAHRFRVNRQTVRSALQLLRDQRLVVTDRRGTFAASGEHEARGPVLTPGQQYFPGGTEATGALIRAGLTWEAPAVDLAAQLSLAPGEPTLVHHHRVLTPGGTPLQRSVSRFSAHALAEIPELRRYRRGKDCDQQPDLRLLYHWMHQAGLRLTRRETIGVQQPDTIGRAGGLVRGPETGGARLAVHRVVSDQHGHALEITDIDFAAHAADWTYEFSG